MSDELRRLFQRAVLNAALSEGVSGQLGRADGTVAYTDPSGIVHQDRVWARIGRRDGITEIVVRCVNAPRIHSLPVKIADRDGVPTVIRVDWARAMQYTGDRPAEVGPHAWLHGRFGPDALYVTGSQVLPLMAYPSDPASMGVMVFTGFYRYDGVDKVWTVAASPDLTSYVPATNSNPMLRNQHFVILCLNRSSNTLVVVDGITEATSSSDVPFDETDIQNVSLLAAYWPIGAIRLYQGQTTIQANDIFMDLRLWGGEHLSPEGSDSTAIHDDQAGEINAVAEKTVLDSADVMLIEDSIDSYNKKKAQLSNLPGIGAHEVWHSFIFTRDGDLTVSAGPIRLYLPEGSWEIQHVLAAVNSAPSGAAVIVDVEKNGTTIFTTQANRPQIAAGAYVSSKAVPDVVSVVDGDYLTFSVDQVGSTFAGSDLSVHVRARQTLTTSGVTFDGDYFDLGEIAPPASPPADTARVYAADDSGTTKVYYKRPNGVTVELSLTVEEQDGSPSVMNVTKIKVTNGTLTDDGGGVVSLQTGGGAGGGGYTEGAHVYNDADVSVPNGTAVYLNFNSEHYDTDDIHSTVTNTNRLTCQTAGKYLITGHTRWPSAFTNHVFIRLNGSIYLAYEQSSFGTQGAEATANLSVGDYVELGVYQLSGSSQLCTYVDRHGYQFTMNRIG